MVISGREATGGGADTADGGVRVHDRVVIPRAELHLSYARAGGPGGQHVNKTSSKAMLRFDLGGSPSVPEALRARALRRLASRLTTRGELVLACSEHRHQARNRAAVIARFVAVMRAALRARRVRKPTRPSAAAVERRLNAKRLRSERKRQRRPPE